MHISHLTGWFNAMIGCLGLDFGLGVGIKGHMYALRILVNSVGGLSLCYLTVIKWLDYSVFIFPASSSVSKQLCMSLLIVYNLEGIQLLQISCEFGEGGGTGTKICHVHKTNANFIEIMWI